MPKTNNGPSLFLMFVHAFAVVITGGWWLLPLFIHYAGPKLSGYPLSVGMTALHSLLSTFTGGLWLVALIFYWLFKK